MKSTESSGLLELFISLFKQFFLRSKESVFWLVIFPTILFLILTTIFGNVEENVELKVKILGESKMLEKVFSDIKQFQTEFVTFTDEAEKLSKFKELDNELRSGKIHAYVVLPRNFDSEFSIATILQKTKLQRKVEVNIYYVPVRQESKLAGDILSSVFNSLGTKEIVPVETYKLSEGEFEYNEFIYPGVVGMAILSVFIFGFMSEVEYLYRRGMLRRFYTTPINIINILIFTALVNMIELILGIFVLSLFANLKGVDVGKYLPSMISHVPLACVLLTLLSLNVLIFSKNQPSRVFVFGQIYFQVQMFAGGFYFPLKFANPVVKNFARFLPLTYTVDAIRLANHLNAFEEGHVLVPIIYILLLGINLILFSKKLKVAEE